MYTQKPESIDVMIENMKNLELIIAEFYKTCGDTWIEDKDFWKNLEHSEMAHANNLERIKKIVTNAPGSFELGRQFKSAAVTTFICLVKNNTEKIKTGGISKEKAYFMALDLERSLIELKYADIIKTNNIEYKQLINKIVEETNSHNKIIDEKIKAIKGL